MASLTMSILTLFMIIMVSTEHSQDQEKLEKLLKNERLQFEDMITSYIPIAMLNPEIWPHAQLSMDDQYDSYFKYPSKMSLNSLVGSLDEIEIILSENDIELTSQLNTGFEKELSHTLHDVAPQLMDRYWQFVREMSGGNIPKTDKKRSSPYNMNGAASDYRYAKSQKASTGMNGEYWSVSQECIKHKGCNIYPIFRILHKTKAFVKGENERLSFSCNDILTLLMPQIYECVDAHDGVTADCPLIIGFGHFRWVFKAKIPGTNDYVVIKMMKQTSAETPRDLLRHLRESIFLYYLRNEELSYMDKYGAVFESNLNEKRAFPYVYELGHCLYPHYISVSHHYDMTIEDFVNDGHALKANISQLIGMSVDIAKGIEILHNIAGGPYHHTDIRGDQFMIDVNGNVLINDFNRGKFQPYYFPEYDYHKNDKNNVVERCNFCPHSSNGAMRAPEEQINRNLDESIDVYSAAFVIWNLFAIERPFQNVRNNDNNIQYLIYDTVRRPWMPSNMPFALKEVIRSALAHNPKHRPNAKQFRTAIEHIYDNLDKYTRNQQHLTSYYVRSNRLFREIDYPQVSKEFPEFKGKSGET